MIKVFIDDQIMQRILSGLFDQVKSKIDLNLNYLKKQCKEIYGIEKIEGVEHKDGNIVVYKDQIACKLNYEVRFPVSVLITTKEKVNSSPSQNNELRTEIDDVKEELDDLLEEVAPMPAELDDFLEEDDDIPEELDDFLGEDDDIPPGLDLDDLEPEHDIIDEPLRQHQMGIYKKKM
ncbi:MAG: hypothetical protein PVH43_14800 [Desulfobacterales bacterium]|jgi:hypothetical protein